MMKISNILTFDSLLKSMNYQDGMVFLRRIVKSLIKHTFMKNLVLTLTLFVFALVLTDLSAQIKTPAPSPGGSVIQTIGLTEVQVDYSRPSMKGRTIFAADGLVPYGKVWRTGANAATKVTFSDDVTVGGKALEAGEYALFTTPSATTWDVHFFPHTANSAGAYGDATAAAVVTTTPKPLPFQVETMMIHFGAVTPNGANMEIIWSNMVVPIEIGVNSHEQAMASIEKTLAGPTNNDYYAAGVYMANNGGDMEKALSYIQKRTSAEKPGFWQIRQEAEVMAKMGNYKGAIEAAEKSLQLATAAGNNDYIKINKDNIAMWARK